MPETGLRDRINMNGRNYKMTGAMRAVLTAVVDAPDAQPAWGFSICESTGLGTGGVYPALDKLMRSGLIRAEWETPEPEGRPRRRHYHPSFGRGWYRANRLLPGEQAPTAARPAAGARDPGPGTARAVRHIALPGGPLHGRRPAPVACPGCRAGRLAVRPRRHDGASWSGLPLRQRRQPHQLAESRVPLRRGDQG